jgi:hypothetical protein
MIAGCPVETEKNGSLGREVKEVKRPPDEEVDKNTVIT